MATLCFNGSLGDELNAIPIVKALALKYGSPIKVKMRFMEIFSRNPYVFRPSFSRNEVDSLPSYMLRFAHGDELGIHMMDHYAKLVGVKLEDREMNLYLDMDPDSDDSVCFPVHVYGSGRKVIAVDPKAGWPSRQWDYNNWVLLVDGLRKMGFKIVEVGATWRNCFGEVLGRRLPNVDYSFVDKLTVRQTGYALKHTDLFVGNDSGVSHLACAVGIDSFTLYGPIHPRSRKHKTTHEIYTGSCTKCNLATHAERCPEEHHQCMKSIKVEHVLNKIEEVIGGYK